MTVFKFALLACSAGASVRIAPVIAVRAGYSTTTPCSIPRRFLHMSARVNSPTPIARSHFKDAPSTLGKPPRTTDTEFQPNKLKIFHGRPQEANGPPIGLFHPAFDSFQRRIDSGSFAPTLSQHSNMLELIDASHTLYGAETGTGSRVETLKPLLSQLLGFPIRQSPIPGVKSDGVIQGPNEACTMIMKVANGADPCIQGAIAFANYWSDHKSEWLRQRSCCPSMILAIADSRMCVLGGVMLEHPVIQSLTPFFLVGNSPSLPGNTNTVAKIFASLAESLSELDDFYRRFQKSHGTQALATHVPYVQHFIHDGKRVDIEYKGLLVPGKLVFQAVARPESGEEYKIVVKFADSYNAAAHRVLEQLNLAPKLFFVSSEGSDAFKVAGRVMVVMEEVSGTDFSQRIGSPPGSVLHDVERAQDALHQHNMVHGDLVPSNILGVANEQGRMTGAMVVDFDWCGTAGQARYPVDRSLMINRPAGAGPAGTMQLEHDKEMSKRLSKL